METVECIVVGGGLAGLSAAYGLAAAGVEVMVLERGDYSGAKNVTGGRLYVKPIRGFYPELWDEAPFERPVARELVTMMADGAHTTVEIASRPLHWATQPQSYTVRARASSTSGSPRRSTEKGAMVVPNMKVDELLRKDGRVIGIRAGERRDRRRASSSSPRACCGCSAARPAWRPSRRPRHHALGYKEIIELPAGVIEDRWHLNPGEGAAQLFMGDVHQGHDGRRLPLHQQGEHLAGHGRRHGARCAAGATARRAGSSWTSSRSCPRSGRWSPAAPSPSTRRTPSPRAASARCRGSPATATWSPATPPGLSLNALVTVRGMDFAIASGYYAAEAVMKAKAAGDFSAAGLAELRGVPARQLRAQGPRDGAGHPGLHGEPAPLHALPEGRLAAAREHLHDRRAARRPASSRRPGRARGATS